MKSGALVLSAIALGGCPKDGGSCTELQNDGRYTLEVLEKWNESSSYAYELTPESKLPPCSIEDVQLKTYDWHITETMRGGHSTNCYEPLCPSDFPTASESLSGAGPYRGGVWLCVNPDRVMTAEACEAVRFVGLETINRATGPFDTPVEGELPPVVLIRSLLYNPNGVDNLVCEDPSVIFPDESLMPSNTGDFYECADMWVVHLKKK